MITSPKDLVAAVKDNLVKLARKKEEIPPLTFTVGSKLGDELDLEAVRKLVEFMSAAQDNLTQGVNTEEARVKVEKDILEAKKQKLQDLFDKSLDHIESIEIIEPKGTGNVNNPILGNPIKTLNNGYKFTFNDGKTFTIYFHHDLSTNKPFYFETDDFSQRVSKGEEHFDKLQQFARKALDQYTPRAS